MDAQIRLHAITMRLLQKTMDHVSTYLASGV